MCCTAETARSVHVFGHILVSDGSFDTDADWHVEMSLLEHQRPQVLDEDIRESEKNIYQMFQRYREKLWESLDDSSTQFLQTRNTEVSDHMEALVSARSQIDDYRSIQDTALSNLRNQYISQER